MPIDYEVRRCTRRCAASDRALEAGEAYVSVLTHGESDEVVRRDYAVAAWTEPTEGVLAWWRSRMPTASGRDQGAPREVLMSLLDEWADRPEEAATRYLLALLLVRRRLLRVVEDGWGEEQHASSLRLVATDRPEPIEIAIVQPTAEQAAAAQQRLTELVGAA